MTPYVQDPDFTLWHGDARDVLADLKPDSIDCALTSPPFYALRDYGVDGQIGLEATPDEWVATLVSVFAGVSRVLKPTGTLWVECGDSYASGQSSGIQRKDRDLGHPDMATPSGWGSREEWSRVSTVGNGLKPKDLLGQPWMLAFALRADGWYLRQAIIWHKPNAMPESATDRCTTAHSYVFLLSKSSRYHFDSEAIAEPAEWARWGDQTVPKHEGTDTASGWMQAKTKRELLGKAGGSNAFAHKRAENIGDGRVGLDPTDDACPPLKNPRSVWTIPTKGFAEAHFATWPEALVERIIKAGCPTDGTILDPFMGSGTSALVARRLGRKSVGIELNETYCEMAARRLGQQSLLA